MNGRINGVSSRFLSVAFCLTATSVCFTGCGSSADAPPIGSVTGKVTFENKPVTEGMVNFGNDEGFGSSAEIQEDGSYTIVSQHGSGIPLGKYKVSITPPPFDPGPAAENAPEPPNPANIPAKYREFSTSGFTADVKEGDNTFDFEMKP